MYRSSDSWLYDGNTRIYDFEQEKAIKLLEEADGLIRTVMVYGKRILTPKLLS